MSDQVASTRAADVRRMTFDNNTLLAVLYGNHDRNLVRIEQLANVQLSARGNQLARFRHDCLRRRMRRHAPTIPTMSSTTPITTVSRLRLGLVMK